MTFMIKLLNKEIEEFFFFLKDPENIIKVKCDVDVKPLTLELVHFHHWR